MIDWLNGNVAYWYWFVFGVALAALEMFIPSFFMLWLGVSAVIVGLLTLLFSISFTTQLLLWGVLSFVCLIAWFKFIAPRMKDRTKSGMAKEALFGQMGTVLEFNEATSRGMLRFPAPLLGEDEWRFICAGPLSPGDKVRVKDISGNDLVVQPNE